MSKKIILTGLRANNELHLGNYLGALLPIVDMAIQKSTDFQINLFVPDLHSFTTPIDYTKLKTQIEQNLKIFVAAGLPLDNPNVHIYRQSYIPAHSEMTIILNSFTHFGEMRRMTQFKEKTAETLLLEDGSGEISTEDRRNIVSGHSIKDKNVSVGLFDYPVLMAADILLYNATYVPVGDDQTQHLEFTRNIAKRINSKFGNIFTIPLSSKQQHAFFKKEQGLRIRDLQNPTSKMSKSTKSDKGIIFLTDPPKLAESKIMAASTDNFAEIRHDYEKQPGISNLLDIYKHLGGNSEEFIGKQNYGEFKKEVAHKTGTFLDQFQSTLSTVDTNMIESKLIKSEIELTKTANKTLGRLQKAIGLR